MITQPLEFIALTSENPDGWFGGVIDDDGTAFYVAANSSNRAYYFDQDGTANGKTKVLSIDDTQDLLDAIMVVKPDVENVYLRQYAEGSVTKVDFVEEIPV